MHAELLQRREQERREAREATERDVASALLALPTRAWEGILDAMGGGASSAGDAGGSAGDAGGSESTTAGAEEAPLECCLCMECFQKDEQIRLLPCNHYFHKDCIDRWFATRAYQQRTCPLCKRDPLDGRCSHSAAAPTAASAESAANSPQVAAEMDAQSAALAAAEDGLELTELPDHRPNLPAYPAPA